MLIGHSTMGRKQFFLPMRAVSFDATAKWVMEFVWHMATAAMVLPPVVLLYAWFTGGGEAMKFIIAYLALQFAAWGAVHLLVISTSGLPGAVYKLFQWTFFLAVGDLAWTGIAQA
jgi:hypothetical protein